MSDASVNVADRLARPTVDESGIWAPETTYPLERKLPALAVRC